jgi:hypothetical protein
MGFHAPGVDKKGRLIFEEKRSVASFFAFCRQSHPYQTIELNVVRDAFYGDGHFFIRGAGRVRDTYTREVARSSMGSRVTNEVIKGLLAFFEAAPAGIYSGPHDKMSELPIFVPDDLRHRPDIGFDVGRLDHPAVFLKLFANYLNAERVNVSVGHQLCFFHLNKW